MTDVVVETSNGVVTVNLGTGNAVSGGASLTSINRLVKVSATGEIGMATMAEGSITGVLTISKTGSTARTVTFPDAAITVARTDAAQTFTGVQTFSGQISGADVDLTHASGLTTRAAATQDAVTVKGRAGGSGSYIATLTPATLSASVTLTLPALTGTLATLENAQTWTAAQTFRAANAVRVEAASTQDAVVLAGRAGGTSSYAATLTPATLSASVTLTLPATTTTLAGLAVAQTFTAAQSFDANIILSTATAASTTAGTLQRETNQDKAYLYSNGIGGWIDKCIFSQYATVTHSGIVTSQSLASGTARGTRTLPANFFKQGKVLKYRLCGTYSTDAGPGNATVLIKIGSTTIRTTGSFALDASITDGYWLLDGELTCYTTGGSGTLAGQVSWIHAQSSPPAESPLYEIPMTTFGAVTFDTTASGAFDVEWTATDAGTVMNCSCFRLWEVC